MTILSDRTSLIKKKTEKGLPGDVLKFSKLAVLLSSLEAPGLEASGSVGISLRGKRVGIS